MLQIISKSGSHNFAILRDGREVATLVRKGWVSPTIKAKVNEDDISFVSTSVFGKNFDILKNTRKCGDITCHWTGRVTISLNRSDGEGKDSFTLKTTDWFGGNYELRDYASQRLFGIKGKISWSNWKTNYTVTEFEHGYIEEAADELLVYCAYALKIHANQSSGIY